MVVVDLAGMKFGMLTVVDRGTNSADNRARWNCLCDCTKPTLVKGKNLRNRETKSCGCMMGGKVHGMSSTRIYKIWTDMKSRCRTISICLSQLVKHPDYNIENIENISVL